MNKNLIYLLLLAVLASLAYFLTTNQTSGTLHNPETNFAFPDTNSINRIVLTDNNGLKIDLRRTINYWTANRYYKAMPIAVSNLLKTIANIQIKSPINKERIENAMKSLNNPIRTVEIFTADTLIPAKKYYIGGSADDRTGNFMILEGAKNPYIVNILGMEGTLASRYQMLIENWKDRNVFNSSIDNIAELEVNYFEDTNNSFIIKNINNQISISNPNNTKNILEAPNKQILTNYLKQYQNINIEAFQNDYTKTDSVKKSTPFCKIKLTSPKKRIEEITIYYKPVNERTKPQFDRKGNPMPHDIDRYFAVLNNNNDFAVIQQYEFGKLFAKYSDFFSHSNTTP